MLKVLIRKQLLELFQAYFYNRKTNEARSKKSIIGFLCLFAFLLIILGIVFFMMGTSVGGVTLGKGTDWVYFTIIGLVAMAMGVFGSVFNTYSSLYLPKDNEFLLAMPIPPSVLLMARLFGVFFTSLLYSGWVWIPGLIAYCLIARPGFWNFFCPVFMTLVIALFVTVLSCILGFLVAVIAKRTKGKGILTVLLSLSVLALYYFVYFRVMSSVSEIGLYIQQISETVKTRLHYFFFLGSGAAGDLGALLLSTLITLVLFGLCFFILSKTFVRFALSAETVSRKKTVKNGFAASSVRKTLIKREFKNFSSVPTWMLNNGIGLVMILAAAVLLLIKGSGIGAFLREFSDEFQSLYDLVPGIFFGLLGFLLATCSITAVSVSIEGKTLWRIRSLPVSGKEVLLAKEAMAMILYVLPVLALTLTGGIVLYLPALQILLMVIGSLMFSLFFADFGLYLNLRHPNFSWTNPTYLTKQSMPVAVAMFGGFGIGILIGAIGFFSGKELGAIPALLIMNLLIFTGTFLLHRWLVIRGAVIFDEL